MKRQQEEAEYERRMQVLNRRVRDDIRLSPTEYEALASLVGPPSSFVVLFREEEEEKEEEEEADEEDMHFGFYVFGFQANIVEEYMSFSCFSGCLLRSLFWLVGFTGDDAPRVFFPFCCSLAQDAPHHGRYGLEGPLRTSLCARFCCVTRSWRNSWWKCRRSYPIPGCSSVWSRTSTFQFLVVEGETLVFKVVFPDRVQQRCLVPRNVFLSGLWSRTLISPLVEASKIISQDRDHPLLRTFQLVFLKLWMSLVKGF